MAAAASLDMQLFPYPPFDRADEAFTIPDVISTIEALPDELILTARSPMTEAVFFAKGDVNMPPRTHEDYEDYFAQQLKRARGTTINALTARDSDDLPRVRSNHERYARTHGRHVHCEVPGSVTFLDPMQLIPYELTYTDRVHDVIVPALLALHGEIDISTLLDDRRRYVFGESAKPLIKQLVANTS